MNVHIDGGLNSESGKLAAGLQFGFSHVRFWPYADGRFPQLSALPPLTVLTSELRKLTAKQVQTVSGWVKGAEVVIERDEDNFWFYYGRTKFVFDLEDLELELADVASVVQRRAEEFSKVYFDCVVSGEPRALFCRLEVSGLHFTMREASSSTFGYFGWISLEALESKLVDNADTLRFPRGSMIRIRLDRAAGTAFLESYESNLSTSLEIVALEDLLRRARQVDFSDDPYNLSGVAAVNPLPDDHRVGR